MHSNVPYMWRDGSKAKKLRKNKVTGGRRKTMLMAPDDPFVSPTLLAGMPVHGNTFDLEMTVGFRLEQREPQSLSSGYGEVGLGPQCCVLPSTQRLEPALEGPRSDRNRDHSNCLGCCVPELLPQDRPAAVRNIEYRNCAVTRVSCLFIGCMCQTNSMVVVQIVL